MSLLYDSKPQVYVAGHLPCLTRFAFSLGTEECVVMDIVFDFTP